MKRRSTIRLLGLLLAITLMTGCPNDNPNGFTIIAPNSGSTVTSTSFEIRADVPVVQSTVQILVNSQVYPLSGVQVESRSSGVFLVGTIEEGLLLDGVANTLVITALETGTQNPLRAESSFIWHQQSGSTVASSSSTSNESGSNSGALFSSSNPGPAVRIDQPTLGEFVPVGDLFAVQGTVLPFNGASIADVSLEIDGDLNSPELGGWDAQESRFYFEAAFDRPGLHRVLVRATDVLGQEGIHKISIYGGEYRTSGHSIEQASHTVITDSGIYAIGKQIEAELPPWELYKELPLGENVYDYQLGFLGADVTLEGMGHRRLTIDIDFEKNMAHLKATILDFYVTTNIEAHSAIGSFDLQSNTFIQKATCELWLDIQKSPGGEAEVLLHEQKFDLEGILVNVPGVPSSIRERIGFFLEEYAENLVPEILRKELPSRMAEEMNKLIVVDKPFVKDVFGVEFYVSGELAAIDIYEDSCRFLNRSGTIAVKPDENFPYNQKGFLFTPNDEFLEVPTPKDLTLALSDDLLNQALYEGFRSGAMNLRMSELVDGPMLADLVNKLIPLGLDDLSFITDLVDIEVRPLVSPVLVLGHDGEDIIAQIHEMVIDFYWTPGNTRQLVFSAVIDIDCPLTDYVWQADGGFSIQPQNLEVSIQAGFLSHMDVRIDELPSIGIPGGASGLDGFFKTIAEIAMPYLMAFAEQTPADKDSSFSSDNFENVEIWGDSDSLFVVGDLVIPETPEDYPIPDLLTGGLGIGVCAMTEIAGGTPWEFLLEPYREFRDRILRHLPGGTAFTALYYRDSSVASRWIARYPVLYFPALMLFIAGGVMLTLVFHTALAPILLGCLLVGLLVKTLRIKSVGNVLASGINFLLSSRYSQVLQKVTSPVCCRLFCLSELASIRG